MDVLKRQCEIFTTLGITVVNYPLRLVLSYILETSRCLNFLRTPIPLLLEFSMTSTRGGIIIMLRRLEILCGFGQKRIVTTREMVIMFPGRDNISTTTCYWIIICTMTRLTILDTWCNNNNTSNNTNDDDNHIAEDSNNPCINRHHTNNTVLIAGQIKTKNPGNVGSSPHLGGDCVSDLVWWLVCEGDRRRETVAIVNVWRWGQIFGWRFKETHT